MAKRLAYTIAEVAEMLAISQRTVRYLLEAGKLRGIRIGTSGRGVRVLAESLDEYIRAAGRDPAA